MIKSAVLLTVYNRREVTLKGLRTLYNAIDYLQKEQTETDYLFDIYMTDDGCTDGTSEAVRREFPEVHIIQGNGKLYWCGGMRKAWQTAIDSGIKYDFYLWLNDDADLYDDALVTIFNSEKEAGGKAIISGAFCDKEGKVSYGGRDKKGVILAPIGALRPIYLMNGNLVLIPLKMVDNIGVIDKVYIHSFGDWDYGCRASKNGYGVYITPKYVGKTDRHDGDIKPFFNTKYGIGKRFKILYSDRYSPVRSFIFYKRHFGIFKALKKFVKRNYYTICPSSYYFKFSK